MRRAKVLLGFAALGIFWGAWGAALPAVQRSSGASDAQLGLALLLVGFGALLSMRGTGVLLDHLGPRLTPVSVALFGLTGVLPALAGSPLQLCAVLFVIGATSGAMDVAINADAVREEAASGRPLLNVAHASFSAAVVAGSLGTGLLRWAGAGPGLVFTLTAVLVLAAAVAMRAPAPWQPPDRELRPRFFDRVPGWLLALGVLGALAFWIESAWQNWGSVQLERTLEAAPETSALAPALFAAAMAVGRLAGNRLLARWSERRLLVGGALVSALGTALGASADTAPLALTGIVVAGAGCSVLAPTIISVAGRAARPQERATIVGSVTTLMYLGFLVGPAAVGGLAQLETLRISLGAVALLALVLAILCAVVRLPGPHRPG
ncbi:MAG TPA: MFS transporter [Gaiellaceae bacterium]|nr:MFS transporter [Gaiellaceae bacterium]